MDQLVAPAGGLVWLKQRPWRASVLAGIGGFLIIGALALVRDVTALPLIIPPFGASCVLVFGAPTSPFARPKNVICFGDGSRRQPKLRLSCGPIIWPTATVDVEAGRQIALPQYHYRSFQVVLSEGPAAS